MENPIATIQTASKGITMGFVWKVFLSMLAVAIIVGGIYWFVYVKGLSWSTVKILVSQEAAKYDNPANAEAIILAGVKGIVSDPRLYLQAKTHAKQVGIPLERVLVNNAVAFDKEYQYI